MKIHLPRECHNSLRGSGPIRASVIGACADGNCQVLARQGVDKPVAGDAGRTERWVHCMVWVVIGLVLCVAVGPILWLLPSKASRRQAAFRAAARQAGLVVELERVPKVDAGPEERVSAGGALREPEIECAAYRLTLPKRMAAAPQWRLLKCGEPNDRAPVAALPVRLGGWTMLTRPRNVGALDECYWHEVQAVVDALPGDCVAVGATPQAVTWYGRERMVDVARSADVAASTDVEPAEVVAAIVGGLERLAGLQRSAAARPSGDV